jgi:hypothetical protein
LKTGGVFAARMFSISMIFSDCCTLGDGLFISSRIEERDLAIERIWGCWSLS